MSKLHPQYYFSFISILGNNSRPSEKTKGKDSFSYVAVDERGGVSAVATVEISIKKQSTKTVYADMNDSSAHYAALTLAESGVFIGEKLGDEYFFRPADSVTRGEFLAMCLKTTGAKTISGITKTGFFDDGEIPQWVKPYVSAGLMSGIVSGYRNDDGRIVFAPNAPITFSEAAVIINKTLGISDITPVIALETSGINAVPAWAHAASVNLEACRILPTGLAGMAENYVTRADAAEMLLASAEIVEARDSGAGLLSWAK